MIHEAWLMGGLYCTGILLFFIILCQKLSINYKILLLHGFLAFLLLMVFNLINENTVNFNAYTLGKTWSILLTVCSLLIGFLIPQEIISFALLMWGLSTGYIAFGIRDFLFTPSTRPGAILGEPEYTILTDATLKTACAFFIVMSAFLVWAIVHKKYKTQK